MINKQPVISSVLLAAGLSRRMPAHNKLLMTVADRPIWRWSLEHALRCKANHVILVASGEIASTEMPDAEHLSLAVNEHPEAGISASIAVGVEAAAPSSDGILILLADQPNLRPRSINRLIDVFLRGQTKIVSTAVGGRVRNPALFHRDFFGQLAGLRGDKGAQALLQQNHQHVTCVEVPSSELLDVDTPADLKVMQEILLNRPAQIS